MEKLHPERKPFVRPDGGVPVGADVPILFISQVLDRIGEVGRRGTKSACANARAISTTVARENGPSAVIFASVADTSSSSADAMSGR